MPRTQYEWECPTCKTKLWTGSKPKIEGWIKMLPMCPKCKRPVGTPTGKTRKKYSLQELL